MAADVPGLLVLVAESVSVAASVVQVVVLAMMVASVEVVLLVVADVVGCGDWP